MTDSFEGTPTDPVAAKVDADRGKQLAAFVGDPSQGGSISLSAAHGPSIVD